MEAAHGVQTETNEVLYEVADHIATTTLNAPELMNLTRPFWRHR